MSHRIAAPCAAGMFFLLAAGCADSGRPIASTSSATLKSAPTFVTVRGTALQPADALAQLAEQSGVVFAAADDREPLAAVRHGAEPKAIEVVNQPFWRALLDLVAPTGLTLAESVTTHGGTDECPTSSSFVVGKSAQATKPRTMFLGRPGDDDSLPPPKTCVSNGFLISARRGSGWTGDGVPYVSLDLSARADPNVPAVWWELTQLDELKDADGKTPEGEFSPSVVSLWKEGVTDVPLSRYEEQVSFDLVATADDTIRGGRIARIKGKARAAVALTSETLEVSGLASAPDRIKRRVWHVGGLRIDIAGLEKDKGFYSFTVRAVREGQSDREWARQVRAFASAPPALYGADGRGFDAYGTSSYGDEEHGRDFLQITYTASDRDSRDLPGRAALPPRPVDRIVWEIPTKVRYVETPFEFTDVPMTEREREPRPDASARR